MIRLKIFINKYYIYIAALLFVMMGFTHLFRISTIPYGINVDEMGMGYDAFCLANFGVDRYLNPYPLYLNNFGPGQSSLYAYLCSIIIKLRGGRTLTPLIIRLPGMGVLFISSFFGLRIIKSLFEDEFRSKLYRIVFLCFYAFVPVYVLLFRIGLDCNLMLPLSVIFLCTLIEADKSEKPFRYLIPGIAGGILLYTYVLSYVILPSFLFLYILWLLWLKRISIRDIICLFIPLIIMGLPLLMTQIVSYLELPGFMLGPFSIITITDYRNEEIGSGLLSIKSIINCIKSIFLFDDVGYNSISIFGNTYFISLPFIITGIYNCMVSTIKSIKEKVYDPKTAFIFYFLCVLSLGCIIDANVYRLNAAFSILIFFAIIGMDHLSGLIANKRHKLFVFSVAALIYVVSAAGFMVFYFGDGYKSDKVKMPFFREPVDQILIRAESEGHDISKLYFSGLFVDYIYYLGATLTDPYTYNSVTNSTPYDFNEKQFGDIYFEAETIKDNNKNPLINTSYTCIVHKRETEFTDFLDTLYDKKDIIGDYHVFWPTEYSALNSKACISWDYGPDDNNRLKISDHKIKIGDEDYVLLVGYAYDENEPSPYDCLYLNVGGFMYQAEATERDEPVIATGKEGLRDSGFVFTIPSKAFDNSESVKLIAIKGDDIGTILDISLID